MVIDPPEVYRHKDGMIVHLVESDPNDWYCWAKYPDGYIHPVPEDVFFRDFKPLKKAASKS